MSKQMVWPTEFLPPLICSIALVLYFNFGTEMKDAVSQFAMKSRDWTTFVHWLADVVKLRQMHGAWTAAAVILNLYVFCWQFNDEEEEDEDADDDDDDDEEDVEGNDDDEDADDN